MVFEIKLASETKGRGMFATQFIPKDTLLDVAHLILVREKEYWDKVQNTVLAKYVFQWEEPEEPEPDSETSAIAMSPFEFCNHSFCPNVTYHMDYETKTIHFMSIRDIQPGEEMLIEYNDPENIWFDIEE
jgi:SET domain-containing protein